MLEVDDLQRGRNSYARHTWMDAFKAFSAADQAQPLRPDDLCMLAWSAYLIGRHDDFLRAMDRAHHIHVEQDDALPAALCAFWMGFALAYRGEIGPAMGWFARSSRLVERDGRACVEQGYLLLPRMLQYALEGDWNELHANALEALEIGERFRDADLTAFALHWQGRALLRLGRVLEGLPLLDESMVAVTAGELSPVVTGVIYCSMIEACHELFEVRRAREWTTALSRWCDGQPDLVPFTGQCFVHRAQILMLDGSWRDALAETRRAGERIAQGVDQMAAAAALYVEGEIHRLSGNAPMADEAYRKASEWGWEPQPGLALLWLAQGKGDAGLTAIRRVLGECTDPLERARVLPSYVTIAAAMGAADDDVRAACRELQAIAEGFSSSVLSALAAAARGTVELVDGDPSAALVALRRASVTWREIGAPYEEARLRVLIALSCRALGDVGTADQELAIARDVFERLGAAIDVAQVDSLVDEGQIRTRDLTGRELEVLRLVAAGKTNRSIADELGLSERTVDRHVSNVFVKLGVASRVAATAYAYEHQLI